MSLERRRLYSNYNYNSLWEQKIPFELDQFQSKSRFIASFAFDCLTFIALLIFLVWACNIRNHRGKLKGVVCTLLAWAMYVDPSLSVAEQNTD